MAEALRCRTVVSGNALTISNLGQFEGGRRSGTMAGQIQIADDFDAPLPSDEAIRQDGGAVLWAR